jgi:UDP:flavonoid glycosyltransferase YjiC (YdhE family)
MSRILFASYGSLGDLNPHIAVGSVLKARGHDVVLASCADYESFVTREGLEFAAVPPRTDALGDREQLTRWTFHPRLGTRRFLEHGIYPYLDAAHAAITRAAAGVDLIVSHQISFTAPVVAHELGLPWLSSVLAPTSFMSRHDPPRLTLDVLRQAHACGPWLFEPVLWLVRRQLWGWEAPLRAFRARHGLSTSQVMIFEGQFSPHGTLALFDAVLAAPQPDWPARTRVCGAPLHDTLDGAEHAQELARFLAAGEPPIVFALGSSAVWMARDYFRAAIRATVELGRRAILLTGQPLPGELPAGICAFNYLPYSQVFPHAVLVVHHAGIGTLSQALRSGRPQLITPAGFDQPDNAERARRLGIARVLPFQKVTTQRLRRELAALLADQAAAEAASRIARGMDGQGAQRAADFIEGTLAGQQTGTVLGRAV